jgi:hypothetical protein
MKFDGIVVPAHSRSKNGVASLRLCRGHPRLKSQANKDVDGRNKSGHDEPVDLSKAIAL